LSNVAHKRGYESARGEPARAVRGPRSRTRADVPRASSSVDGDLLPLARRRLGQRDGEDATLERRLHLVRVDAPRQRDGAVEGAVGLLATVVVLLLLLLLLATLTLDGQDVVAQRHLDVLL